MGQLLLGVFHPGVVLIKLGCVLLGGENGGQGDVHHLHFLVVKVLAGDHRLALHHPVEVRRENVSQLPQPLPVIGSLQFLFLNGQLPGQPGAQILHRFPDGLAFLTHGILPIPEGVVAVQQSPEGFRLLAASVLPDGAEGKLLGSAVRGGIVVGPGVHSILPEKVRQLPGGILPVQSRNPGIDVTGGEQRRLPAYQGGQAAQGVHQPVRQHIRPGPVQNGGKVRAFQRIFFGHRFRRDVFQPRQGGPPGCFIQTNPAQAVQNPPVGGQQVQVAGPAHQLRRQLLLNGVSHFVGAVKGEKRRPLHGKLGDFRQPGPQKVLSQQHTEHGRLRRVLRRGGREVEPGSSGIHRKKQLFPAVPAAQMQNQGVPAGLVDFVHPGPQAPFPNLRQYGGQKDSIKCHVPPPVSPLPPSRPGTAG